MKTLKLIFSLLTITLFFASCSPQALEDDRTNAVEDTQATGDDSGNVENGGKN